MRKKEMIAMLLAGGQGSRLGVLTEKIAKPAVMFGGKYRIIDFPLSNCVNSGIDTVGVLTQYEPLLLTKHIGIGIPWDLDLTRGGITVLSPYVTGNQGEWYSGTANAIYRNIRYIDSYNPEYILILSGDHVYKMDYNDMLEYHKQKGAALTIAVIEVPIEEANQFGIMNTDETGRIIEFEEKPQNPKSNLASMGIYIFDWAKLRTALIDDNTIHTDSDFGKHIIPHFINMKEDVFAYTFKGYWRDIGTIQAFWEANMDLASILPEFNLYDSITPIYTNSDNYAPQYIATRGNVSQSMVSKGCEIEGTVYNSILSPNVKIEKGVVIRDSIIMENCIIREGSILNKVIISEGTAIGANVKIGQGDDTISETKPHVYNTGITVIGSSAIIPDNVVIGKNCDISGETCFEQYPDGRLESGKSLKGDE